MLFQGAAMNDEGFVVFFYGGRSLSGLLLAKNLTNGSIEFNGLFKKFGGRSNGI